MELYLIELTVSDWSTSLDWYRDRLGLPVLILDTTNQYALLGTGPTRVALKSGTPTVGTVCLTFLVQELDSQLRRLEDVAVRPVSPIRTSVEGYRVAHFADPDGYRVALFEWTSGHPESL